MDLDEISGTLEYIVCRWSWQILGAIRTEARARRSFVVFCQVSKGATSLTTGRPNFTKLPNEIDQ